MKKLNEQLILRSYIRRIIKEETLQYSEEDLYKAFIKPFVDVVGTAVGKTKELTVRAQTILKVALETALTILLPFGESEYKEIFEAQDKKIEEIQKDYAEVYKSTKDALGGSGLAIFAFTCFPAAAIGATIAKKGPKATANVLSTLSGGALDDYIKKGFSEVGVNPSDVFESVLREDEKEKKKEPSPEEKKKDKLMNFLTNEKVIKAALNTPQAQRMQSEAQEILKSTLEQVMQQAEAMLSSATVEDIEKKMGQKIKGLDDLKKIEPKERAAAEKELLSKMRKSMKSFYVKNLEAHVKEVLAAGIPENSGYVQAYADVIRKIKSL
jgi:hypothetical protein